LKAAKIFGLDFDIDPACAAPCKERHATNGVQENYRRPDRNICSGRSCKAAYACNAFILKIDQLVSTAEASIYLVMTACTCSVSATHDRIARVYQIINLKDCYSEQKRQYMIA
jgi:hypothetical protein